MQDFLFRMACADPRLVEVCADRVQLHFKLIGGAVFLIGLLTGLSGYYAAGLLFDQFHSTLIFGIIWGLMFLNLYRYMLVNVSWSDMLRTGSWWQRPWGSVLLRAALIGFFSVVMAKPIELFLLRPWIEPRLAGARQQQHDQVEAQLRRTFQADEAALRARIAKLDEQVQLLNISLHDVDQRLAFYDTQANPRLEVARRAAQQQRDEILTTQQQLAANQQAERAGIAAEQARLQQVVADQLVRFDELQQQGGTFLLRLQVMHRDLPWAEVLTVGLVLLFLAPLIHRQFWQLPLQEYVRKNTWEEDQTIKAAYSQFKLQYARTMRESTGLNITWHDEHADPRTAELERQQWEQQQPQTGRLADVLRGQLGSQSYGL
jgi:Domain of unknown function (DUF4407)